MRALYTTVNSLVLHNYCWRLLKNIAFIYICLGFFWSFICSKFVLGTISWVTFSLFMHYSTALLQLRGWIVDKSRFLSLEKFESLWLVPLRCCELATLGAFFLWPALTAYLWPNMDCKMPGCQILIQPKGVQFRFL